MIIFMGVIVGFVAVAMVSAMYGIYSQVNVSGVGSPLHTSVSDAHRLLGQNQADGPIL